MDEMLANDLAVIWRSEVTAIAADREMREAALALGMFWAKAGFAATLLPGAPERPGDGAAGSSPTPQPAWPEAVVAASEPGPDAQGRGRRAAELEQRLAKPAGKRPDVT